jgi:hypothetical protein
MKVYVDARVGKFNRYELEEKPQKQEPIMT